MHRNLCILAVFFLAGAWYAGVSGLGVAGEGAGGAVAGVSPAWAAGPWMVLFWLAVVASTVFLTLALARGTAARFGYAAVLGVAFVAGLFRYAAWDRVCAGDTLRLYGRWVTIVGTVVDSPSQSGDYTRFKVSIESADGGPARGLVMVSAAAAGLDGDGVRYGDRILVEGTILRPRPRSNPGGFDRAAWLRIQGVRAELRAGQGSAAVISRGHGNPLVRAALWLRERLEASADAGLPQLEASLLKGIVLGSKTSLPDELEEDFRHAGIYHILSVSGLHVSFVLGALSALMRRLRVPRKTATIVALTLLPAYGLITGLKAPVIRSIIMAFPVHAGPYMQRKADSPASLALAAVLAVTMWPGSLFDPGFHLSFGATAGLVALSKPLETLLDFAPPAVSGTLAMTVAAQISIAPLVMSQFQEVSLVSLIANPVVVPVVGWATAVGFAGMIAGLAWPLLSMIINIPNRLFLWFVMRATSIATDLPGSFFTVYPPGILESVAYYALLFAIYRAFPADRLAARGARIRLVAFVILSAIALWICRLAAVVPSGTLRVVFFDAGHGDAILVRTPGGTNLLVDAGPQGRNGGDSAGRRILLPALRRLGVGFIDTIVLTHFHDDHYGGMADVLDATGCGGLIVPRGGRSRLAEAGIDGRRARRVEEVGDGYAWESGGVRFEVLNPAVGSEEPDLSTEDVENERSIVLTVTFGSVRVLLTGDAGGVVERRLVDQPERVRSTVLKVGHHGSNLSSCGPFLDAVKPDYCIVCVGPNSHGLPSRKAMVRLQAACSTVLRTDERGAITVETDGANAKVTTMIPPG